MFAKLPFSLLLLSALFTGSVAADVPKVEKSGPAAGQLLVDGKSYLILGGELGNSSAGTAAQADEILPRLAQLHVNTVLMPVAWEQIEPKEGDFDFSILDHWIDTARLQHLHLVLLWFGAWKNAFSNYAPTWVKADPHRFPRALSVEGQPLEILSTFAPETLKADSRAFAALMQHVRDRDSAEQTVLMVQVENEVGYLGRGGRDRSPAANALFRDPVPPALLEKLKARTGTLSPELAAHFHPEGKNWSEVFGEAADEVFMAYHYAGYIESVTAAGKRVYPLPMYVNCQLPAPSERPGEYPSGGPHPYYLDVYRAVATSLDFFSPDIYWPNFEYWINRFTLPANPVFVPEARLETAPFNALYAYGGARAFGFSAFGIDSLPVSPEAAAPPRTATVAATYSALDDVSDTLLKAQTEHRTRALILHASSPRPTETVALDGFLFQATLSRSWPARTLLTDDGALLLIQTARDEFLAIGSGLNVTVFRDPDTDNRTAGIASIEEVTRSANEWQVKRRLNGDQSDQGRQLSLDPHEVHTFRIRLYTTSPMRTNSPTPVPFP